MLRLRKVVGALAGSTGGSFGQVSLCRVGVAASQGSCAQFPGPARLSSPWPRCCCLWPIRKSLGTTIEAGQQFQFRLQLHVDGMKVGNMQFPVGPDLEPAPVSSPPKLGPFFEHAWRMFAGIRLLLGIQHLLSPFLHRDSTCHMGLRNPYTSAPDFSFASMPNHVSCAGAWFSGASCSSCLFKPSASPHVSPRPCDRS
jgi:hypothetical protein